MAEIKGMSGLKFNELLSFVQQYHSFALCMEKEEVEEMQRQFPHMEEYGFNIKYVDSVYDSRGSDIWSVSFRGMGNNVNFNTNTTLNLPYETLFDWIMAYLKKEWQPTKEEVKHIIVERK